MSAARARRRSTRQLGLAAIAAVLSLPSLVMGVAAAAPAASQPLSITTTSLPNGVLRVPYPMAAVSCPQVGAASISPATGSLGDGLQLSAAGGTPGYSWSFSGDQPPGLKLEPNGTIEGIPQKLGVFDFTAQVTDSSVPALSTSEAMSLTVATSQDGAGAMSVAPSTVQPGSDGQLSFVYTASSCGLTTSGEVAITLPTGWAASSATASPAPGPASAGENVTYTATQILLTNTALTPNQMVTISSPGTALLAPSTSGMSQFVTSERYDDSGLLADLAMSPSIDVGVADVGTMVVSPGSLKTSGQGPLTFTYTAGAGGLGATSAVTIKVPSGWPAPSRAPGSAGFFAASPAAVLAVAGRSMVMTGVALAAGQQLVVTFGRDIRLAPHRSGESMFRAFERSSPRGTFAELAALPVSTTTPGSGPLLPIIVISVVVVGLGAAAMTTLRRLRARRVPTGGSTVRAVPHAGGSKAEITTTAPGGVAMQVRIEPRRGERVVTVERTSR